MKDKSMEPKSANGSVANARPMTAGERQRMIAEAAYFRAIERNFQGGDALDDWCVAEREVDAILLSTRPVSGAQASKHEQTAPPKRERGAATHPPK